MANSIEQKMRIDIVSDVVCPWCIIGYKQLERALEITGTDAEIHWHPFELNPDMVPEGENLREHIAAKYGTPPENSGKARARLTALGAELGFTFNYADDMRMVNTFRAHQLIHWAEAQGREHDMKMELIAAFFTNRLDLNNTQILADCAAEIGLDRDEALAVVEDGRYAKEVREAEHMWQTREIQGVPAVIFDERFLVSGAQGVENFAAALKQISERRAA